MWLLTPTACNGRCEDGWLLAPPERPDRDDEPCPVCRGGWLLSARREESDADDDVAEPKPAAARSLADAVSYRPPIQECAGRGGTCGRPVTSPHTQCPECLDWPWCVCRRCRPNPEQAACPACSTR